MKEKIPVHTHTYMYACAAMRKMRGSGKHPLNKAAWPCSGEEIPRLQIPTHHCCSSNTTSSLPFPPYASLSSSFLLELSSLRIHPLGWGRIKCVKGSKRQKISVNNFPRMYCCKILLLITLILKDKMIIPPEHFHKRVWLSFSCAEWSLLTL